jgi:hypothetical protein
MFDEKLRQSQSISSYPESEMPTVFPVRFIRSAFLRLQSCFPPLEIKAQRMKVLVLVGLLWTGIHSLCNAQSNTYDKLVKAKEEYAESEKRALKLWENQIDAMIQSVKRMLPKNQGLQAKQNLLAIKSFGNRYDGVSTKSEVMGPAASYYKVMAEARWKLYLAYEALHRQKDFGKYKDVDAEKLEAETLDFMRETEDFDKIKPGVRFSGSRHDPMHNIHTPIEIEIVERNGHQFHAKVHFNGGRAIFHVAGSVQVSCFSRKWNFR